MVDKELISKKDKNIIGLIFGIPILFFIGFVGYSYLVRDNINNVKKENDLNATFGGKVVNLFRDEHNHNIKTAVLSNNYIYLLPSDSEDTIKIGDSLSKKKNTLKLEVYRQGQPKMILDYHDTYKKEKR